MAVPVIALVGRPNVGKSTFFNRLTKTQKALVADFPGLTRDRQYGEVRFKKKLFFVVDTGGIGVDDLAVDALMSSQSLLALQESTRVFFIVDARSGLTAIDQEIAKRLHQLGKPVDVLINKVDGMDATLAFAEFQSLGFASVHTISASHGHGVFPLLSKITDDFPEESIPDEASDAIHIAFVGRPNVGKSTLMNRILGYERVVVYDMPGTTRDSISVPFTRDDQSYILIDTAGLRRRSRVDHKIEKFSIVKTLQAIQSSQVCLLLIDGQEGLTEQDMHLLGTIIEAGKALVVIVNKWDDLDSDHKEHVKSAIERKLHFAKFAKVRYISALHGSGVGNLFKDILQAYASANQRFSTSLVTKLLQDMVQQHEPPLVKGRRVKLRYAHFGGHNPPVIVIHGNQLNTLPDHYRRYLIKGFTENLKLVGTPLKLELKEGQNPYQGRKNQLTDRQQAKRKRLMRFVKKT